jgi:uncharacterized protein involved in outer membrane biogenesis
VEQTDVNKILIGIGGIVFLLIAAVVVGPGFIDWNNYKVELASQAEGFTGRKLVIDGNIEVSILPSPALVVNNVRLANVDGATAKDMVHLKSLQVRVALGPLLSGQVKVQTVHLVDPVIELERFADGRTNMEFVVADAHDEGNKVKTSTKASPQNPSGGTDEAAFSLDNFVVENATVIFRDAMVGSIEEIEKLNATFAAASMNGPFESSGSLVARGFPLEYDVSVGKIIEQRTAPLSLTVSLQPGQTKTTFSGAIIGLDEAPTFKGLVKATGANLAELIQSLGPRDALPGLLGQAFGFEGELEASAKAIDIANLSINLGKAVVKGAGSLELADVIAMKLDLGIDSIDFDDWMALPEVKKATIKVPVSVQEESKAGQQNNSVSLEMPAKPRQDNGASVVSLPTNIDAILNFKANSLTVNGGLVRQVRLSAELSGGEVTISQLSALMPGSTDVALFGFVVQGKDAPRFDGEMEVSVGDLRGVLAWLGAPPPPVPTDRLRKMTLASKVSATAKTITASDLDMQFDSSRMMGKTAVHLGKRLSVDADLTLDRINLDAYLAGAVQPVSKKAPTKKAIKTPPSAGQTKTNKKEAALPPELAGLQALKGFDSTIKARVKTLVYGGNQVKNVVFDGALLNSALTVKRFSIDKFAGSSFKASGQIKNLDGIPEMKGILLDVTASDLSRLFRLAGAEAPVDSKKMGAVIFKGKLDGSLINPLVDVNLKGAGAAISAAGKMSFLPVIGGFNGKLKVVHGDLVKMLRSLGVDYRPGGKLGGLNVSSDIKADMAGLTLNNLNGLVGPVKMNGTANVSLTGPRTKISADLNTGKINADQFLPAAKRTFLIDLSRPIPASFTAPRLRTGESSFRRLAAFKAGRWPTDPIDFSALKIFDADIKMKSTSLTYGNYTINNADIKTRVDDGVLQVEKLNGRLFGGVIDAKATVRAASPSTIETTLSLQNLNVASGLKAVIGESPAAGKAGMNIKLASSGYTVSDLVAALAGNGAIALKGLDVAKGGKGTALSAALGLVAGLNSLGGNLTGKKAGAGLADINGTFNVNKGIATSNDLTLVSSMGNGRAQGNVDLSRWLIDVAGQVEMSQNFLGMVLNKGNTAPSLLPFSIKGNLNAPNVKLDTSKIQGAGLPIPGLDKVLKKKGIGSLLQKVLPGLGGGGSTQTQPASPPSTSAPGGTFNTPPPPPPPPPPSQPQQIKPQDLIKDIFKSLGG